MTCKWEEPALSITEMVRKCKTLILKNEPGIGHMKQCLEYYWYSTATWIHVGITLVIKTQRSRLSGQIYLQSTPTYSLYIGQQSHIMTLNPHLIL